MNYTFDGFVFNTINSNCYALPCEHPVSYKDEYNGSLSWDGNGQVSLFELTFNDFTVNGDMSTGVNYVQHSQQHGYDAMYVANIAPTGTGSYIDGGFAVLWLYSKDGVFSHGNTVVTSNHFTAPYSNFEFQTTIENFQAVPEPAMVLLFTIGLLLLIKRIRKNEQQRKRQTNIIQ